MKNLKKYIICVKRELSILKIEYNKSVKFQINNRSRTRWGQCSLREDGSYVIEISNLLLHNCIQDKFLKEVIAHELLHTVNGCMNHGKKWKTLASQMNCHYGYNIKRCASYYDDEKEYNYILQCKNCGQLFCRKRYSKIIKNIEQYECGACGGYLQRLK